MSFWIGFSVIGVAHVATHGKPRQLAAKMVFLSPRGWFSFHRTILGADKATTVINQQRLIYELPRKSGGPSHRFCWCQTVMRVGRQRAALACFPKYITLLPTVSAIKPTKAHLGLRPDWRDKTKTVVRALGTGRWIGNQIPGAPCF